MRRDQAGGIDRFTLENGVRAARLRTLGGLDVLFILDRAMDAAWCSYRGVPLVWHGPGALLPSHPGTLSDDAFERRFFGGLMTTCGLEAFGPSGSDRYGTWGEHGHINHIAASDICAINDVDAAEPFVELRGTVSQDRMFGESLRLERTWRASLWGSELWLHDRVTNEGGRAVPHMLLYHCNAGYPLLNEGTEVSLACSSTTSRDAQAASGLERWNRGGPPQSGFKEQVYIHAPLADSDGWCRAKFTGGELERSMTIAFRPDELPACFSWRMLGERTYVMAVEPANCPTIAGRTAAMSAGTLPFIEPGETREYHVRFSFA